MSAHLRNQVRQVLPVFMERLPSQCLPQSLGRRTPSISNADELRHGVHGNGHLLADRYPTWPPTLPAMGYCRGDCDFSAQPPFSLVAPQVVKVERRANRTQPPAGTLSPDDGKLLLVEARQTRVMLRDCPVCSCPRGQLSHMLGDDYSYRVWASMNMLPEELR